MPPAARLPFLLGALAWAACGGMDGRQEVAGDGTQEGPPPEDVEEPVDPLPGTVRTACGVAARYWNGHPAAQIRTYDSLVTVPGDGGSLRDACLVEVVLHESRDPEAAVRTPFTASGWFAVYEFDADGPATRSRVYQDDPVRCHVAERWDAGIPGDSTLAPVSRFSQRTTCWRRNPLG